MARGVNKVILIGNLGGDPQVRYAPSGDAVANVSLATNESWTDKTSGEKVERTEWHKLVFFRRLAEVAGEYLKKGAPVYVEGKLQTRKWQDKDGTDRWSTEIVVSEMQMLGGRDGGGDEKVAQQYEHAHSGRPAGKGKSTSQPASAEADFNDDVPF